MDKSYIFIFILLSITGINCIQYDCSTTEYNKCVKIADPLVKEIHLIFPDNLDDIDRVCRTWNRFVDCLSTYTDKCFTYEERKQFNKAVRSSIESVHQMCMDPGYQKEYLIHAPCLKSTITDRNHCGAQYNTLVNQVSRGDDVSRATLCCTHERFKRCVAEETSKLCDHGVKNGAASRFSGQIIEKALSFLQDQCFSYIPNVINCDILIKEMITPSVSSETYPYSTINQDFGKELPTVKKSTTPWLPSTSVQLTPIDTDLPSVDSLGTRTRPSSYGRSSSWSDFSENPSPSPNFDISSTYSPEYSSNGWVVSNYPPKTTDYDSFSTQDDQKTFSEMSFTDRDASSVQTWYPAAGDQIENEVEEPNQQGLVKPHNGAKFKSPFLFLTFITIFIIF